MKYAFVALSLVVVGGLFAASGASADGSPAIHVKDGLCNLLGANADGTSFCCTLGEITNTTENGNRTTLKCRDADGTNDSGRGQNYRDFVCGIDLPSGGFVLTEDTHAAVGANGVSTLDCTYENSDE